MKKLLLFFGLLFLSILAIGQTDPVQDKGTGIWYFSGVPTKIINPTYQPELAINVLTGDLYFWNRNDTGTVKWERVLKYSSGEDDPITTAPPTGFNTYLEADGSSDRWWINRGLSGGWVKYVDELMLSDSLDARFQNFSGGDTNTRLRNGRVVGDSLVYDVYNVITNSTTGTESADISGLLVDDSVVSGNAFQGVGTNNRTIRLIKNIGSDVTIDIDVTDLDSDPENELQADQDIPVAGFIGRLSGLTNQEDVNNKLDTMTIAASGGGSGLWTDDLDGSISYFGNVDIDGNIADRYHKFISNGSASYELSGTVNPIIGVRDATNGVYTKLQSFNGFGSVGTQSNHSLFFQTNNTNVASFTTAGDFSIFNLTNAELLSTDATGKLIARSTIPSTLVTGLEQYENYWTKLTNNNLRYDNRIGINTDPLYDIHVKGSGSNSSIMVEGGTSTGYAWNVVRNDVGSSLTSISRGSAASGSLFDLDRANNQFIYSNQHLGVGTFIARDFHLGTNKIARQIIRSGGNIEFVGRGTGYATFNNDVLGTSSTIPSTDISPTGIGYFVSDGTDVLFSTTIPTTNITGLAPVATSGDYNDLINQPTTPAVVATGKIPVSDGTNYVSSSLNENSVELTLFAKDFEIVSGSLLLDTDKPIQLNGNDFAKIDFSGRFVVGDTGVELITQGSEMTINNDELINNAPTINTKNISEGTISNYGTFASATDYIITEAAANDNNTIKGSAATGATWQAFLIGTGGAGNVEGKTISIYNTSDTNDLTLAGNNVSTSTNDIGKFGKMYQIPPREIWTFVHDGNWWIRKN